MSPSSREFNSVDGFPAKETAELGSRFNRWAMIVLIAVAGLSAATLAVSSIHYYKSTTHSSANFEAQEYHAEKPGPPRNLIFIVTDGMGPSHVALAREYKRRLNGQTIPVRDDRYAITFERHLVGQHRTMSLSNLITDSASAAAAFACGMRVTNQWTCVDENSVPRANAFEAAVQQKNFKTGLVVKSSLTDATPAGFSAHVSFREYQDLIAEHQLANGFDVMLGGGMQNFHPSVRADKRDLLGEFASAGYKVVHSKQALKEMNPRTSQKVLGLFAEKHMAYSIDRKTTLAEQEALGTNSSSPTENDSIYTLPEDEPSFLDMTVFMMNKMEHLTRQDPNGAGFMVLVEASRIDHAAHANEPASVAEEVLEYEKVFDYLKQYVDSNPDTVIVATSDHETGGLTIGSHKSEDKTRFRPAFWLNMTDLLATKRTISWVEEHVVGPAKAAGLLDNSEGRMTIARDVVKTYMGLDPAVVLASEWKYIDEKLDPRYVGAYNTTVAFNRILLRLTNLEFTSTAHTAPDVNVYAYGTHPSLDELRGTYDNFEIGQWIIRNWGLDMERADELVKDWAHEPPKMAGRAMARDDSDAGFDGHGL